MYSNTHTVAIALAGVAGLVLISGAHNWGYAFVAALIAAVVVEYSAES